MTTIHFKAEDGAGQFSAYIAMPAQLPAPAIVLIQEIFGVNADMRAKCDECAAKGYIAVCPDLFWRQEPGVDLTDKTKAEWEKAFALMNGFDTGKGIDDLITVVETTRVSGECTGKVGAVGYCLGGKLAYLLSARSDVDASVGYYGVALDTMLGESENIHAPLMLHIAELDKFSTPDARDAVVAHFKDSTIVTPHVYAGVDHAFARKNGDHYDGAAADLANARTDEFFSRHLKA